MRKVLSNGEKGERERQVRLKLSLWTNEGEPKELLSTLGEDQWEGGERGPWGIDGSKVASETPGVKFPPGGEGKSNTLDTVTS